ncbi:MAG: histidinol dehydrogenase [Candidatus Bathyarchaeota archaeon]|uniref:histidinol dehydrogenase n=3 Tax=Candidatus Bathycorpusculum sp. TaxID=2994959 RepID=UPI002832504A|nr:histidinol dehydrogenase [Candidatus Termiticorpusculum sp.]MCL2293109.1 histidinol dehydrogenase [Candidatus Termiticorpusculum sp.]
MQTLIVKQWTAKTLPPDWFKPQQEIQKNSKSLEDTVKTIISQVRKDGDKAIIEFVEKFDKTKLSIQALRVSAEEIRAAYCKITPQQLDALLFMKQRVETYQKQQVQPENQINLDGISIKTVLYPLDSVGCYVPGGQAAYPSTVIMTVVPAKVAGVKRIVVCSPTDATGKINDLVIVASDICGVDEVYKIGGAQAIAALAYGTQTIRPVRKIVGPGSKYVTMAKVLVSTDVAIDMPAGPSEVLILADETADPRLIAFDMISQAEHGTDSVAGLITTSNRLAENVQKILTELASSTERSEKISESLKKYGFIITCDNFKEMVELSNQFAPEHLEVITKNAQDLTKDLVAGLILLGPYSPVPLSDYASGTNHVLPTGTFAQSFSALGVFDFSRRVSIVECSKAGLEKVRSNVKVLAYIENLPNHYKAIDARF